MEKYVILAIVVLALVCYYFSLSEYLTFASIKSYQHALQVYVNEHYVLSVLLYILSYTLVVALSLPVAALFTLLGGSLFGALWGALYAVIGASTGATLSFLMVRYLFGEQLQQRYKERLIKLNKELEVKVGVNESAIFLKQRGFIECHRCQLDNRAVFHRLFKMILKVEV